MLRCAALGPQGVMLLVLRVGALGEGAVCVGGVWKVVDTSGEVLGRGGQLWLNQGKHAPEAGLVSVQVTGMAR